VEGNLSKKIYGVNVAVRDLDQATKKYEEFFGVKSIPITKEYFAFPGLDGVEFNIGGFRVNLIASTQEGTPIAKFLETRGEGLFLLSVEVDDLKRAIREANEKGFDFLLKESANGPFGSVNFIHPRLMSGVQVELYEPSEQMLSRGRKIGPQTSSA
jgi:methylmalonyl-CoA/ethylmalonyl-CoA epimerase